MKFRCSHRSRAADASSIYDARFRTYDPPTDKMKRQLTITRERIEEAALLSKREMSDGMGDGAIIPANRPSDSPAVHAAERYRSAAGPA